MFKVKVKSPFFDNTGLHNIGDVMEVKKIDPVLMEEFKEDKPKAVKAEAKAEPKKAPARKKG